MTDPGGRRTAHPPGAGVAAGGLIGDAVPMASGHDEHDHQHESSFFVVPPLIVGLVIGIVLIVLLGTESGAVLHNSPF